jgi:hypothetical protein
MGEVSRALDMGEEITHGGRVYRIRPLPYEGQGFFELWLKRRAYEEAEAAARFVGAARADRMAEAVADKAAAGVYDWGGELCGRAAQSPKGQIELLALMMMDEKSDGAEVRKAAREIMEAKWAEAVRKMGAANADPTTSPGEGRDSPSTTSAPSSSGSPGT